MPRYAFLLLDGITELVHQRTLGSQMPAQGAGQGRHYPEQKESAGIDLLTAGGLQRAKENNIQWVDHGKHCCARSEEHTSELQSLMRTSCAVFCMTTKNNPTISPEHL